MPKKSNEVFLKELKAKHPNVDALDAYAGSETPIRFRCNICGEIFTKTPYNIIHSPLGCKNCSYNAAHQKRKVGTEAFKERLKSISPTIKVVGEYTKAKEGILCECMVCHHQWSPTPSNLMQGKGCPKCHNNLQLTNEEFVKRLKVVHPDIKHLEQIRNTTTSIKVECNECGKIWPETPLILLSRKKVCPKCNSEETRRQKYIEKLNRKHPHIQLIGQLENMDTETSFSCKRCGAVFNKKPYYVLRSKEPCEDCGRVNGQNPNRAGMMLDKIKKTHPDIDVLGEYKDAHTKIIIRCRKCGEIMEKSPTTLLRTKYVCNRCYRYMQTSFPEQAIYFNIKNVFPDAVSGYKEGFGKSELDIYIPSKKIGIEYDGRQWHKGEKAHEKEEKKYNICKKNGIYLIRIKETKGEEVTVKNSDCLYTINDEPTSSDLDKLIETLFWKEFKISYHSNINKNRSEILQTFYNTQYDKSLAVVNPSLAAEWHPEKNGVLKPENVPANSGEYAWWKCSVCGNEWFAEIASRNAGSGCQACFDRKRKDGLGLRMSNDEFVKKIESLNLDLKPLEEYVNSHTKILVQCKKCGRKWKVYPYSLTVQHTRCNKCFGKPRKSKDEFSKELKEKHPSLEVLGDYTNYESKIKVKCIECGKEWESTPATLLKGAGCSDCRMKKRDESNRNIVINWKKRHPSGSKAKCHSDTGLGMTTINKWWKEWVVDD